MNLSRAIGRQFESPRTKYFVVITLKGTGDYIGSGGGIVRNVAMELWKNA